MSDYVFFVCKNNICSFFLFFSFFLDRLKMKQPICQESLSDFKLSTKHCKKYKINTMIATIPLSKWSNIEDLIEAEFASGRAKSTSFQSCFDKFVRCFSLVSSCLCRHPQIQTYASNVERYLKTPSIKKQFEALYNDKCDEEKIKKNKRKLNRQTRLISQTEVMLEDRNNLLELEGQLSNTESYSASKLTSLPTTSSSAKIEMRNVKEIIFNHAKELHRLYQRGDDLSTEQLEAMSKGLSCILDLSEPEKEGTLRCLFSDDLWTKLIAKYTNRFKTAPSVIDVSLIDKWSYIINLYNHQNSVRKAKLFLNQLKCQDNLKDTSEKVFDFYEEILILVESKEFMLNTTNALKISERDYVYQIWLPLFSKLFNINKNIVRIKTGETVPENTTESKADLYHDHTNVVGFKTDLRILVDFDEEEFDLVCGEGCLRDATDKKVGSDMSKLAREGKEVEVAIQQIYNSTDKDSIKSKAWLCQFIGPRCIFSTLHATKYQYHVIIPEFSLSFATSFLGSDGINSIKCLFNFRDSVETAALAIKKILRENKEKITTAKNTSRHLSFSPERLNIIPEPTWFTPPRSDRSLSRIPSHMVSESGIESDDDGQDKQEECTPKADVYGFIKTKTGWFSTVANTEFTTHPYHI